MGWEPRVPLTLAEQQVDFDGLNRHILERRQIVEQQAQPPARRIAAAIDLLGIAPATVAYELASRLSRNLKATARFGHAHARRELRQHRAGQPVRAAYAVPDAGAYSHSAAGGLDEVRRLIERRSQEAAEKITAAVTAEGLKPGRDRTERTLALADAARRATHNLVLELVGEALNMGRAAGVVTLARPPEYAMRSEQLDKRTCQPCESVHGQIVPVDSPDYYTLMPPSLCLGAGRCRGLWVHGDEQAQISLRPAAR